MDPLLVNLSALPARDIESQNRHFDRGVNAHSPRIFVISLVIVPGIMGVIQLGRCSMSRVTDTERASCWP